MIQGMYRVNAFNLVIALKWLFPSLPGDSKDFVRVKATPGMGWRLELYQGSPWV